jgi:primary-amine oxidase
VGSSLTPLCAPSAAYLLRAGFLCHNLWVTPYVPSERYPSGDFPNQRGPDRPDGLEAWAAADRPVADVDVVVWHVFGVQHAVRLEDFPVMPSEHVGFALKPDGFFDSSPCIDVPCTACERLPNSKL